MRRYSPLIAAVGLLTTFYVPASHLLKAGLDGEARFSHRAALGLVVPRVTPNEYVFASSDRFLVPFVAPAWAAIRHDRYPLMAWIFPSAVNMQPAYAVAVQAAWLCFLAARDGRDLVWGLDAGNVAGVDRATGKASLSIAIDGERRLAVDFPFTEVLYEVRDGLYLRGAVERVRDADGRLLFERGRGQGCA